MHTLPEITYPHPCKNKAWYTLDNMATVRQRRVAKLIIENATLDKPITDIEILKRSNYSTTTAETKSTKVIASEGVQEVLKESGFTEENAKAVVEEIMLDKKVEPNARLKATDQVFKVQGTYAPEKSVSLNIEVPVGKQKTATDAIIRFLNEKTA